MREGFEAAPRGRAHDYPYFRRLWNTVVLALLAVSFVPLLLIGGGMYYYSALVLEKKTLDGLQSEVINHKRVIDQFLTEHVNYLKLISQNPVLRSSSDAAQMRYVLGSYLQDLAGFHDLGVISSQGDHLAYVGPHDLAAMNYSQQPWFQSVSSRPIYISDVFEGFRKIPHFIVAVKFPIPGDWRVIRATVNADPFNEMVAKVGGRSGADAFLLNQEGLYQTRSRIGGKLMTQSDFRDLTYFPGVEIEAGRDGILSKVWLDQTRWLCVVRIDRQVLFAQLHQVRTVAIFVFLLGGILIVITVLLTTNYLVTRLETSRRSILFLDQQLRQASSAASAVHLAQRLVEDLKDSLGGLETAVSQPADSGTAGVETRDGPVREKILAEAARCRELLDRFQKTTQPQGETPIIADVALNALLDDLIYLLGLASPSSDLALERDYQPALPIIRSDFSLLRLVFQNLLLNAVQAVTPAGKVTIRTRAEEERVRIEIIDDGVGIPPEILGQVFDPLFTTKRGGLGLGLTVADGILKRLGGSIKLAGAPVRGTTVTVEIPIRFTPPANDPNNPAPRVRP
ncbi:MAG: ATP-binding protein [Thermodesulfobacteriota bacterium]